MGASDLRLRVLGTRGSLAISGEDYREFGGNTSCYMVQAGEETIFLDAGSGIFSAPDRFSRPPVILLSHLHLDHVIGLGMFPAISRKGQMRPLIRRPSRTVFLLKVRSLQGVYQGKEKQRRRI